MVSKEMSVRFVCFTKIHFGMAQSFIGMSHSFCLLFRFPNECVCVWHTAGERLSYIVFHCNTSSACVHLPILIQSNVTAVITGNANTFSMHHLLFFQYYLYHLHKFMNLLTMQYFNSNIMNNVTEKKQNLFRKTIEIGNQ